VEASDKSSLQDEYLNLELVAIKNTHLRDSRNMLAMTKKKGAEDLTPNAYKEAIQHYDIAEKLIETDRHNTEKIAAASKIAALSANRVSKLIESTNLMKNQTPEERATLLVEKELELKRADEKTSNTELKLSERNMDLAQQSASMNVLAGKNEDLQQKQEADMQVQTAAEKFSEDEADVYRQDGHLVIRLKKMNFASGRSDLPADSLSVLAKVKEVIRDLDSDHVRIEGHTDSIGKSQLNQKLSENRAATVAKHFMVDNILEENQIDSVGFGFSKPLASNKTKEGREQNRRVDILIKTN
jgi:OOP family OmpA-OmpF porin